MDTDPSPPSSDRAIKGLPKPTFERSQVHWDEAFGDLEIRSQDNKVFLVEGAILRRFSGVIRDMVIAGNDNPSSAPKTITLDEPSQVLETFLKIIYFGTPLHSRDFKHAPPPVLLDMAEKYQVGVVRVFVLEACRRGAYNKPMKLLALGCSVKDIEIAKTAIQMLHTNRYPGPAGFTTRDIEGMGARNYLKVVQAHETANHRVLGKDASWLGVCEAFRPRWEHIAEDEKREKENEEEEEDEEDDDVAEE